MRKFTLVSVVTVLGLFSLVGCMSNTSVTPSLSPVPPPDLTGMPTFGAPTFGAPTLSMFSPLTTTSVNAKPMIKVDHLSINSGTNVTLYLGANCTGPSASSSSGNSASMAFMVMLQTPGTYTFSANFTDGLFQTTTPCSVPISYTLLPPLQPSAVSVTSPNSTSDYSTAITVSVTGAASGHTVKLYTDPGCVSIVGSNTAGIAGATISLTGLITGSYTYYAKAFNEAGYPSACSSASASYTLLPAPVPSGITVASSGYTTNPAVTVSGVSSGVSAMLFNDSSCTTQVGSAIAYTNTVTIYPTLTATGVNTFYAKTSVGGNTSACSTTSASYNLLPAPIPTSLVLSSPSSSPGTNAMPTIVVGGIGNGLVVKLFSDASCTTQIASSNAVSATVYLTTSALALGSYNFYASTSNTVSTSACSSASVAYTFTTLPLPSLLSLVSPASPNGYYQTPTIRIGGVEPFNTVKLYTDNGCTMLVGTVTASGSTVDITTSTLAIGAYSFYAKAFNSQGGFSNCSSATVNYVVTSRAPFYADQAFAAGTSSESGVISDFNGDGKPDLYYAGDGGWYGGILTGTGAGSFLPRVNLNSTGYSQGVAAGDFNGDSRNDIAVVDSQSNVVRVMLGNGNNTFQPPVNYAASGYVGHSESPGPIAVADLNSDGKLDLVVGNGFNSYGSVSVFLGNGDGTFQNRVDYLTYARVTAVEVADIDGDGKFDIVATCAGKVSILLGNGDGTLQAKADLGSAYPSALAIADLNGDGKPDLVETEGAIVSVQLNLGSGNFASPVGYNVVGGNINSVVVGDVDGDGHSDIVVSNRVGGNVAVFFGLGDGTFDLPMTYGTDTSGVKVFVLDIDGDGDLDIVQLSDIYYPNSIVHVLKNKIVP